MITNRPEIPRALIAALAITLIVAPSGGAATVTWDAGTDATWTGPSDATSWTAATYNDGDDAQFNGAGVGTVTVSGTVNPNSLAVTAGDYTFAGGAIGGAATLTKGGAGTLALSAANTYTGATTIDAGTLRTDHLSALGTTAAGTTVNSGATLQLNTAGNYTEPFTINGSGVGGIGALTTTTANKVLGATLTLGSDAAIGGTNRIDMGAQITDNGNGYTLTKTGTFDFVRSGAANISHLVINQGAYTMTGDGALPGGAGTSVTVETGARLVTWANRTITNSPNITFENGSFFRPSQNVANPMSINGTMTLNGSVSFEDWSMDATVHSDIGGAGNLTLKSVIGNQDSARYTLTGNNTYTGSTTVGTGAAGGKMTAVAGSNTAFGTNSAIEVTAESTLNLGGFDISVGSLAGAGTVENVDPAFILDEAFPDGTPITTSVRAFESNIDGNWIKPGTSEWTVTGGKAENASAQAATGYPDSRAAEGSLGKFFSAGGDPAATELILSFDYDVAAGDKLYVHLWGFTGTATNTGWVANTEGAANGHAGAHEKGAGSTLEGYNLTDGNTTITGLAATAISGELTGAGSSTITIDIAGLGIAGVATAGDLDYYYLSVNKEEDGTAGATTIDNIKLYTPGAAVTLTTGGNNAATTFSGVLRDGTDGAAVALTKTGTGRLSLDGANSYTGVTTITGGQIRISNNDALGTAAGGTVIGNATKLELAGGITIAEPITNQGGGGGKLDSISGTNTLTGPITLEGSMDLRGSNYVFTGGFTSANNSGIGFNGSNYIVQDTPITIGTGGFGVTSAGNNPANATQINVGGNDWGLTTINFSGYLQVGGTDFLPTDTEVRYGWSRWQWSNGTLDLNGHDQTVRALGIVGNSSGLGGDHKVTGLVGDVLTINLDAASTYNHYQGRFEGGLSVVKTGAGTLILENLSSTTAPAVVTNPSPGPAVPSTNTGTFTISEGSVISRAGYGASDAVTFPDASDLLIQAGATLKLDYSGTDTIDELILDGAGMPAGTWGASGSGATHIDDTFFTGTGTLTVGSAASPYATWATTNALTGTSALAGSDIESPNPDGMTNLLEFGFGTDPTASDNNSLTVTDGTTFTPGQPVVEQIFNGGNPVKLRYVRRKDHVAAGLTYTPKFTDSTGTAIPDPATPTPTVVSTMAGDYEVVEVPFPLFDSTGKKATALIAVVEVTLN